MGNQDGLDIEYTGATQAGSDAITFGLQVRFKRPLPRTDLWETKEVLPHPRVAARNIADAHAKARELANAMLADGRAAKLFH